VLGLWLAGCAGCGHGSTDEPTLAVTRELAVTVDDLPVSPADQKPGVLEEITSRLLAGFARHEVPAIGFVNENKLFSDGEPDPRRVALLERWLDAGLELGNHGYSHLDLHRVALDEFQDDVLRGEVVTRELMESRGRTLR
jgi:peptidoglycan/xylan/chitin deacetylase (PgdA/CDA1 family)